MKNLTKSIIYVGLLFLISCNRNEYNTTNPVFENSLPEAVGYKAELAKLLEHQSIPPAIIDKLEDNDSVRLLYVNGDSLCATAILTVRKQEDKLDAIIKAVEKDIPVPNCRIGI